MKHFLPHSTIFLALILMAPLSASLNAQDKEFLTSTEINSIQDAQDHAKRVVLYLAFARKRIEEVKEKVASKAPDAGEWIQTRLEEYTAILDVLEESLQIAREQRSSLSKPIKQMETDITEFQTYLQTLNSAGAENFEDYKFTLEEALETTGEDLADAKKGAFPEVKDRTPPTDLPSRPPRPGASPSTPSSTSKSSAGSESPSSSKPSTSSSSTAGSASDSSDGPPRKRQPAASTKSSSDGDNAQDGPPRKSSRSASQDQ